MNDLVSLIQNNAGPLMAMGVPVLVALIGAYAMIRAKRSPDPIKATDLFTETRVARDEADEERRTNIFLERKLANIALAFLALWAYCKRLMSEWGSTDMPRMRRDDQERIDRIVQDLEDIDTPPAGVPIVGI